MTQPIRRALRWCYRRWVETEDERYTRVVVDAFRSTSWVSTDIRFTPDQTINRGLTDGCPGTVGICDAGLMEYSIESDPCRVWESFRPSPGNTAITMERYLVEQMGIPYDELSIEALVDAAHICDEVVAS